MKKLINGIMAMTLALTQIIFGVTPAMASQVTTRGVTLSTAPTVSVSEAQPVETQVIPSNQSLGDESPLSAASQAEGEDVSSFTITAERSDDSNALATITDYVVRDDQGIERTRFIESSSYRYSSSLPTINGVSQPEISEDGKYVIYAHESQCTEASASCIVKSVLGIYSLENSSDVKEIQLWSGFDDHAGRVADAKFVSGTDHTIEVTLHDGSKHLYDAESGQPVTALPAGAVATNTNADIYYVTEGQETAPNSRAEDYIMLDSDGNELAQFRASSYYGHLSSLLSVTGISSPDASEDGKYAVYAYEAQCTRASSACVPQHYVGIYHLDGSGTKREIKLWNSSTDAADKAVTGASFVAGTQNTIEVSFADGTKHTFSVEMHDNKVAKALDMNGDNQLTAAEIHLGYKAIYSDFRANGSRPVSPDHPYDFNEDGFISNSDIFTLIAEVRSIVNNPYTPISQAEREKYRVMVVVGISPFRELTGEQLLENERTALAYMDDFPFDAPAHGNRHDINGDGRISNRDSFLLGSHLSDLMNNHDPEIISQETIVEYRYVYAVSLIDINGDNVITLRDIINHAKSYYISPSDRVALVPVLERLAAEPNQWMSEQERLNLKAYLVMDQNHDFVISTSEAITGIYGAYYSLRRYPGRYDSRYDLDGDGVVSNSEFMTIYSIYRNYRT